MCVCVERLNRRSASICFILSWGDDGVLLTFDFVGSFYLVFRIVSHGFIFPWDDAGTHSIFETAGGARDAHWTGTNEDASVSSVISMGTLIDVPASFFVIVARG